MSQLLEGIGGSSLYTSLLPRRQSDTSLATICASFRLARVNAHGGAVGACDNVVDSKPESRSTGIALGERLRRGLLDGHAEDLIGSGVDSDVRRPIRQDIVYLNIAKPWLVVLPSRPRPLKRTCRAALRSNLCRPDPAP